ncbi:laccase-like [Aphidius gifuensis]|uniref:laccase-like n=1 Tax=Aphidius gifuensis TaxID=684658 RepID=UPI001CDC3E68|nr:laccase-like [Aphidius gifuensis]
MAEKGRRKVGGIVEKSWSKLQNPATGEFTNTPLAVINVKPGARYRFRMINTQLVEGGIDKMMKLILFSTLIILAAGQLLPSVQRTFKSYSKSQSKWITHPYYLKNKRKIELPLEDNSQEKLKVGQTVDDWGRVAGPEECARECVAGAPPKLCYYHWTVQYYNTNNGACDLCVPKTNSSITSDCQCVYGDGYNISGILTVNRMFPGPSIQVCLGDLVVVDVKNMADGHDMTIHWHGIYQKNYQHYDGAPFITQCPIQSGTTFRYKWRAQNIGTHWWHSHTGLQQAKMLEGAIVIRQPKEDDNNYELYDRDDSDNIIILNDWFHSLPDEHFPGPAGGHNFGQIPENILINGQGKWLNPATGEFTNTPLAVINVEPGVRYRFRMINTISWDCPLQLSIQDHDLKIISADGENVKPVVVNTITSFAAERYDFILNAYQKPGNYWIQVRLIGFCFDREIIQLGILRYSGSQLTEPTLARPTYNNPIATGIIFNNIGEVCDGSNPKEVCVKNLESADPVDPRILAEKTDVQFFLPYTFYLYNQSELFEPGTYKSFMVPTAAPMGVVPLLNGITNRLATSPLLTQADKTHQSQVCSGTSKLKTLSNNENYECTHVLEIPLNSSVEIIMYDEDRTANLSHPFHLHGYGFHVMAQGSQNDVKLTPQNIHRALQLDQQRYKFNSRPPVKDTLAVPPNGYTIVRFIADNPGYWFYHCHILPHLMIGMSLVIHVGTPSDVPPTPPGFPTCGNFQPPI